MCEDGEGRHIVREWRYAFVSVESSLDHEASSGDN